MSDVAVNERIKILIKHFDITPYRLAKVMGVHPTVVYNMIRGKMYSPKPKHLRIICEEYNVNGDWLLTGRGEMFIVDSSKQ